MVEGSGDDSQDGGRADEGSILSPSELDITESEYVEEIEEGRFVVSPGSARGESTSPNSGRGGQQPNQGRDGPQSEPREGADARGRSSGGQHAGSGGGNSPANTNTNANAGSHPGSQQPTGGRQSNPAPSTGQPQSRGGSNRRQGTPQLTERQVREWLRQRYQQGNSKYAFDVTAQFNGQVSQRQLASNDLMTVFESLMLWYAQQVDSGMPVEEVLGILLTESNVPVRYPPETVKEIIKATGLGPDDTVADLLETVRENDGVQL